MKIGVNAFAWTAGFGPSWFHVLPGLRERGLDGFEFAVFEPEGVPAREIGRAIEANGLECTVCAILPAGINPISPDVEVRRKSLAHLVRCIELTAEAGGKLMGGPIFAPVGYLPGRRRTPDEWAWAVECFQALAPTLDAYGIDAALEPLNRLETFFLTTAAEGRAFCEAVGHPRVGVLVDTFHSNIEERDIASALVSLGGYLKHIHASENDRGVPGRGHLDWAGIVAALKQMNYQGYLMIEGFGCSPNEGEQPVAIWRDLSATPEEVAFEGAALFNRLRQNG